jgi:ArsR family metal-binding transcriptional regulator
MKKEKVVIIKQGGAITGVFSTTKVSLVIIDHDELSNQSNADNAIQKALDEYEPDYISSPAEIDNVIQQELCQYREIDREEDSV